jgi:hypothetical protein
MARGEQSTDPIRDAFRDGFDAGAEKEHALAADCVRKRLARMPEEVRAVMLAALEALGLEDLADPESEPVACDEDAAEAWEALAK